MCVGVMMWKVARGSLAAGIVYGPVCVQVRYLIIPREIDRRRTVTVNYFCRERARDSDSSARDSPFRMQFRLLQRAAANSLYVLHSRASLKRW